MITGIFIGAGIVVYFLGFVFFLFLLAQAGHALFGVLFGLLWPILAPIYWLHSKMEQNSWKKEKE